MLRRVAFIPRGRILLGTAVILLILTLTAAVWAFDDPSARATLKGIPGVRVVADL